MVFIGKHAEQRLGELGKLVMIGPEKTFVACIVPAL